MRQKNYKGEILVTGKKVFRGAAVASGFIFLLALTRYATKRASLSKFVSNSKGGVLGK